MLPAGLLLWHEVENFSKGQPRAGGSLFKAMENAGAPPL
jgi:hypothetical protein